MLCCGYTLTDFPTSIRLTSLVLWQFNDCPSASKATLMNMDKYFMWIHYERLHNHNKAKHNKTVCIFLGIYCMSHRSRYSFSGTHWYSSMPSRTHRPCAAKHCHMKVICLHFILPYLYRTIHTYACISTMCALTHGCRDKMAAIFQTTFSNAFSWMIMYEFRLRYQWSLFLRVKLTIFQHCFR